MGPQCLFVIIALFACKHTNGQMNEKNNDAMLLEDEDTTVTINRDIQPLFSDDPVKFLQLGKNIQLEDKIKKIQDENKDIVNRNIWEIITLQKKESEMEQKYKNKMEEADAFQTNQGVLLKFMKNILYFNDKKVSKCEDSAQAQRDKLEILEEEKKSYQKKDLMNLKNADLQDVIIKRQEREIEILGVTLKTQTILYEDYKEMNNFDLVKDMDNFPVYAQLLTKTLADQDEKIKQMIEYFEGEKEVNENMEQVLQELKDLKLDFLSDKAEWDLLDSYKELIATLDANLKSILPVISYGAEDNSQYQFKTADDGTLLEMTNCQCLPLRGTRNVNFTFSSVELTCPEETLFSTTLQSALEVPCKENQCPQAIGDFCGNFTESGDWVRYPNKWGDGQCTTLGDLIGPTLAVCKASCFKTEGCTAFNWGLPVIGGQQGHCVLLSCGLSAAEPNGSYPGYHGFKRDCDCKDCGEPTTGCLEIPDKCQPPWTVFGDNCYKNITTSGSAQCRSSCQAEGADITSIHSEAENEFLSNLVAGPVNHLTYIGADCTSGSCVWMDGSPWDYTNWAKGNPGMTEYCTSLGLVKKNSDHGWYDGRVCTYSNADCICKK